MSRTDPLAGINSRKTPQRTRAPGAVGARQVKNNAGGYVFSVSDDTRLHRFLTLGTEGGTYYQGERELTRENAKVVITFAENRGLELVSKLIEVSEAGRAPKQNPTIFSLAAAAGLGNDETRAAALAALPRVCRTTTHLALFVKYVQQFRGWGNGLMKAISKWYVLPDVDRVAYQIVKYRNREGWTHRDLLRKSHPGRWNDLTAAQHALFNWAANRNVETSRAPSTREEGVKTREVGGTRDDLPAIVGAFEEAQAATTIAKWTSLIEEYNLPWEALPDAALSEPKVWATMISRGMPQTALMRQLPRLTRLGVLADSGIRKIVVEQLKNEDLLKKGRVHPVNVLIAQKTYASGRSVMGSSTWSPVPQVTDALDEAFYAAYGSLEPANKRTLVALDVSGSMGFSIAGMPLTAREAGAALALVISSTEPDSEVVGFSNASNSYERGGYGRSYGSDLSRSGVTPLDITRRRRLDDVVKSISNMPFNGTDCALPMIWAGENGKSFDTFIVITDSETWAGNIQPQQALATYRETFGIPARQVVVGMTSTGFTIADPNDPGTLDVAGFDSAVPNLISDFSRGDI